MLHPTRPLCEAIAARRLVRFSYSGKTRVVEPHCHGTDLRGNDALRAFQVSSSDGQDGWRFFHTAKIGGLVVLDETFAENRPDYRPDDEHLRPVHCCV